MTRMTPADIEGFVKAMTSTYGLLLGSFRLEVTDDLSDRACHWLAEHHMKEDRPPSYVGGIALHPEDVEDPSLGDTALVLVRREVPNMEYVILHELAHLDFRNRFNPRVRRPVTLRAMRASPYLYETWSRASTAEILLDEYHADSIAGQHLSAEARSARVVQIANTIRMLGLDPRLLGNFLGLAHSDPGTGVFQEPLRGVNDSVLSWFREPGLSALDGVYKAVERTRSYRVLLQ